MASNQVGTFVKLKIGTAEMVGESSVSLAMAITMIELSSKADGNTSSFVAGRVAETLSVSSIGDTDGAVTDYNIKEARAAAKLGTSVEFTITEYTAAGVAVVGATTIVGRALISGVSADYPDNDKITFSLDMQVTGDTTDSVNT